MHASIGVALAYDRHLNGPSGRRQTLEECFHLARSTTLLNKRLKEPIETKDKDPIWGTAAALLTLTFSSPDACTLEDAWPLNPRASSALDWLPMNKSKMALMGIMDPLRPDSLFHIMATTFVHMNIPPPKMGVDGIPRKLASLCHLDESSTQINNPYFNAAHGLSRIIYLPDAEITTGLTQPFMQSIEGPFENLLRERDPTALLMLYLWYKKTSRSTWWIELRARVECTSIRSYLKTNHRKNSAIQEFLERGLS